MKMEASTVNNCDNQDSLDETPKTGAEIAAVKRRNSNRSKIKDVATNRLSQRASILCMCQCDGVDLTIKAGTELSQSKQQCEFHGASNGAEGVEAIQTETLSEDTGMYKSNVESALSGDTDHTIKIQEATKTCNMNGDIKKSGDSQDGQVLQKDNHPDIHETNVVNNVCQKQQINFKFPDRRLIDDQLNFTNCAAGDFTSSDECAPDVYGTECLASISTSGSLNSIYITSSDDVEETVVDIDDETRNVEGHSGSPNRQALTINNVENADNFDETLKCNTSTSQTGANITVYDTVANETNVSNAVNVDNANDNLYSVGAFGRYNADGNESEDSEIELEDIEISVDDIDVGPEDDVDVLHNTVNQNGDIDNVRHMKGVANTKDCADTFVEIVPVKVKSSSVASRPLCSSTPLVKFRDIAQQSNNADKDYPTLSTFKPLSDISAVKPFEDVSHKSSSAPLCSSTPVIKQVPGLKVRDTNIVDKMENKLTKRNIIDDILGLESCIVNGEADGQSVADVGKENENKEIVVERIKEKKTKDKVKRKDSKRDKNKVKGTRIEKYKEYMGPGLTCNPSSENEPVPENKKDMLKNTDIETCTLTEYKGFGLTGPLSDKPKHASTPAPAKGPVKGLSVRDPNIQSESNLLKYQKHPVIGAFLARSKSHVINRPAGLEGFLLNPEGQYPPMNTLPIDKPKLVPNIASKVTLNPALLVPPADCVSGSSGQGTSGTSSALQPDDIYPSQSSVRSDKSDNYSTDKSDRSSKSGKPTIEASVLQSFAILKKKKKLKTTLDSFLKDVQWIKTAAADVKKTNSIKLTDITSSGSGNETEANPH